MATFGATAVTLAEGSFTGSEDFYFVGAYFPGGTITAFEAYIGDRAGNPVFNNFDYALYAGGSSDGPSGAALVWSSKHYSGVGVGDPGWKSIVDASDAPPNVSVPAGWLWFVLRSGDGVQQYCSSGDDRGDLAEFGSTHNYSGAGDAPGDAWPATFPANGAAYFACMAVRVEYTAAAGGTTYNVSLSESGSATESISALLGAVASLSESASAAESLTATTALVAALAESATAADLVNSGQQVSASLSEAATAADAITALLSASAALTEAASAADSLTAALAQSVSLTESVAASDVLSAVTQLVAALSEAISASDTMTVGAGQVYGVSISESATTADALSAALLALAQLAESASSAEQLSAIASLQAALTEAGTAADVVSGTMGGALPAGRWLARVPRANRAVIVRSPNRTIH